MDSDLATTSAAIERLYACQIAHDLATFQARDALRTRPRDAADVLATVRFLILWDRHFATYQAIAQTLLASGRPQIAATLRDTHIELLAQLATLVAMHRDDARHAATWRRMIDDAVADHQRALAQAQQEARCRLNAAPSRLLGV